MRCPATRRRCSSSSFSVAALEAFARLAPDIPRGMLTETLAPGWRETASRLGAAAIACDQRNLRREDATAAHDAGFLLAAYTVNDPHRALELFGWGVDSVFSDAPDIILGRADLDAARPSRHRLRGGPAQAEDDLCFAQ